MFEHPMGFFDALPSTSEPSDYDLALGDMMRYAETFGDWKNVFYRAEGGSISEKTALLQMATRAKTFGNWLNVYWEAEKLGESVVVDVALAQLVKLADDPCDVEAKKREALRLPRWQKIFNVTPIRSKPEKLASAKIITLMRAEKIKQAENTKDLSSQRI